MKKRIVSLLLASVMVASLLFGCGPTSTETDAPAETNAPVETDASKETEAQTEGPKELTTVKILCKDFYSVDDKVKDWTRYPVSQKLIQDLEKIGIRLELEMIDVANFGSVVQTRIAAGIDLPDMIAYCWVGGDDAGTLLKWAETGLIYPINELLDQYDADDSIRTFYKEYAPSAWETNTATDGNNYWFSYLLNSSQKVDKASGLKYTGALPHVMSIRKDWLDAIGEELKEVYTPEELAEVVKKMQDADVNGNGLKDEILSLPISGYGIMAQAFGMHDGILCGYFEEDSKVTCNLYHENFPAYVNYMKGLVDDGLIDEAVLTSTQDELVSQNRVAVGYGYSRWDFEALLPNVEADKEYYVPIMVDMDGNLENGYTVKLDALGATTYCHYIVPTASENAEAVVRLMDYIYTREYALMSFKGLEGYNYTVREDGLIDSMTRPSEEYINLFTVGVGLYALPAVGVIPSTSVIYAEDAPQYKKVKQQWTFDYDVELFDLRENTVYSSMRLAMPTEEETAITGELSGLLSTYAAELLTDLILGNESLDNLPGHLEELEGLGLQDYMDVIQARRDRFVELSK